MRDPETILADLAAAIRARDPTALEDAVYAAFEADLPAELGPALAEALLLPWHFRHEEIALALYRLNDPSTVPALAEAALAKPVYLAQDEPGGLTHRCIAALARIGNDEAVAKLEELARSNNRACAKLAAQRLHARKGLKVGGTR